MSPRKTLPLLLAVLLLAAALPAWGERGDDTDRPSKNGKAEGTIDGVEVTVEYGRPKVKDREIWGGLVPYGKVWRTGANEATTITFSQDVKVEGQMLAAGTYGLFAIPSESEWTIAFNSVAQQWGAFDYDKSKDVLRVTVKPQASEHVEEMTFEVGNGAVTLGWEKLAVSFSVAAEG